MVIELYSVKVKSEEQVLQEYLAGGSSDSEVLPSKGSVCSGQGWEYSNPSPDLPADSPMRNIKFIEDEPSPNPENIPIGAVSDGKGGWNWSNPDISLAKDIKFYDDEDMAPSGNVLEMKSMPGMKVQRPSQTDKASEATDQTAQECPTLCPKKVELQDNGAKYGYDDFTSKNTVYLSVEQGQAVFEFKVTRLPAQTVDFDSNKDRQIDTDSWMSKEMKRFVDACKDDGYDHNMFIAVAIAPTLNLCGDVGR